MAQSPLAGRMNTEPARRLIVAAKLSVQVPHPHGLRAGRGLLGEDGVAKKGMRTPRWSLGLSEERVRKIILLARLVVELRGKAIARLRLWGRRLARMSMRMSWGSRGRVGRMLLGIRRPGRIGRRGWIAFKHGDDLRTMRVHQSLLEVTEREENCCRRGAQRC